MELIIIGFACLSLAAFISTKDLPDDKSAEVESVQIEEESE